MADHPPFPCGKCRRILNMTEVASDDEDRDPVDGDVTVCKHCLAPHIFRDGTGILLTEEEIESFSEEDREILEDVIESLVWMRNQNN